MEDNSSALASHILGFVGVSERLRNIACDVYRDIGELDAEILRWWVSNDTDDEGILYLRAEVIDLHTEVDYLTKEVGELWSYSWDYTAAAFPDDE